MKVMYTKKKALITLQDCNGTEIEFPDVKNGESPSKGDKAIIDGQKAEGSYMLPDGTVIKFTDGAVSKIVEPMEEATNLMAMSINEGIDPTCIRHKGNVFVMPFKEKGKAITKGDFIIVNGNPNATGVFNRPGNISYKLKDGKLDRVIKSRK